MKLTITIELDGVEPSVEVTVDTPDEAVEELVEEERAGDVEPEPQIGPPPPQSQNDIINRLLAGERSPELLAYIDDPAVSVPEEIAAQKTYPDPAPPVVSL